MSAMQLPFIPLTLTGVRPDLVDELGPDRMPPLTPEERENRIATRRRDIEQTKNGESYKYYVKHMPKQNRCLTPKIDPDRTSVRSWKGYLRVWRKCLHEYREFWEGESQQQQQPPTQDEEEGDKSEVAPSESMPDLDSDLPASELGDSRLTTPSPAKPTWAQRLVAPPPQPKPSWASVVHAAQEAAKDST